METFSFNRFCLVMKLYLRENLRTLLLRTLGLLAALCLVTLWIGYVYNTESAPWASIDRAIATECVVFSLILMFLTMMSASGMMFSMSTKESRLSTLMLPASMLEKYLVVWIIDIPVFVGVFIGFAYVADFVRYAVFTSIASEGVIVGLFSFEKLGIPSEMVELYFMVLIVFQSIFALGATLWQNKAFIKTLIALVCISVVFNLFGMAGYHVAETFKHGYFSFPRNEPSLTAFWIMTLAFSLGLYVLAYFRFRESEIINRW